MTNEPVPVSNWTLATGTKPGERYVHRDAPRNPVTHPTAVSPSRVPVRDDEVEQ